VIPHISTFKDPDDPAIDPSKHIYAKDLHLKTKLRHWRTAFLSLLVHYYDTKYLVYGLREPDCVVAASNEYKKENDLFMTFFSENFVKETGAGPVTAKEVRNIFREWKRALGRAVELKETAIFDRMKQVCGGGSTDKEFWNVRVVEAGEDLSGALLSHMP
jgi:phage/plasmid-associated DNA primase